MTKMQQALAMRPQTGTSRAGWMRERWVEKISASSRPRAQIRCAVVCCIALVTNRRIMKRATRNAVAAVTLDVAWIHSW